MPHLVFGTLQEHPQVTKVSDMARHAGEAWRNISPHEKEQYEAMSTANKVGAASCPHVAIALTRGC